MVPLVRAVPPKVAMEMLLTGIPITAQRALAVGLVNRVVPADQLDASIRELTDAIVGSSAAILSLGKRAFYDQLALDEPLGLRACHLPDDRKRGPRRRPRGDFGVPAKAASPVEE